MSKLSLLDIITGIIFWLLACAFVVTGFMYMDGLATPTSNTIFCISAVGLVADVIVANLAY